MAGADILSAPARRRLRLRSLRVVRGVPRRLEFPVRQLHLAPAGGLRFSGSRLGKQRAWVWHLRGFFRRVVAACQVRRRVVPLPRHPRRWRQNQCGRLRDYERMEQLLSQGYRRGLAPCRRSPHPRYLVRQRGRRRAQSVVGEDHSLLRPYDHPGSSGAGRPDHQLTASQLPNQRYKIHGWQHSDTFCCAANRCRICRLGRRRQQHQCVRESGRRLRQKHRGTLQPLPEPPGGHIGGRANRNQPSPLVRRRGLSPRCHGACGGDPQRGPAVCPLARRSRRRQQSSDVAHRRQSVSGCRLRGDPNTRLECVVRRVFQQLDAGRRPCDGAQRSIPQLQLGQHVPCRACRC